MFLQKDGFPRWEQVTEGKTKAIYEVRDRRDLAIAEYKPAITAYDDPKLTQAFGTKAADSCAVTCRLFEMLQKAGLPVAYLGQLSATEFVAPLLKMASVELITRRRVHPKGSIRKRRPELPAYHRFPELTFEVCLKTNDGGKYTNINGEEIDLQLIEEGKPVDDPLVLDPFAEEWQLIGKTSITTPTILATIKRDDVVRGVDDIKEYRRLLHMAFLVIEGICRMLDWNEFDIKVECGTLLEDFHMVDGTVIPAGTIMIGDVLDPDSWRVINEKGKEYSKQAFRDMILSGEIDLDEVARIYRAVAEAISGFHVREQALVLWRGSDKDSWPTTVLDGPMGVLDLEKVPGVAIERVTLSGHKQTKKCLVRLNEIMTKYSTGVIYAKIGMSDGLAPIIATHTTWPVLVYPATMKEHSEDVWSSLNLPSNTPVGVVGSESNTMLQALRALAPMNPIIYAWFQYMNEQFEAQSEP